MGYDDDEEEEDDDEDDGCCTCRPSLCHKISVAFPDFKWISNKSLWIISQRFNAISVAQGVGFLRFLYNTALQHVNSEIIHAILVGVEDL